MEVYRNPVPADEQPKFKSPAKYPASGSSASPETAVGGGLGVRVELHAILFRR